MVTWYSASAAAGGGGASSAGLFGRARPIKLEVGAGTGDWIVVQAEADPESNWAAVELRCDRACLIHAKGAMRELPNLAVLAGDAHGILTDRLPSKSVAHCYVNFPQPPQASGSGALDDGYGESEGHLVNTLFLHQAHRILQPGGTFTLTTDDEKLVTTVCQRLVTDPSLHARWQPAFGAPHYKAHENGLRGHRSAFDELWAARGFARRFQCRFTAKRPREAEMHQMAAAPTVTTTTAAAQQADDPKAKGKAEAVDLDAGKRKRKKETSKNRKKRRTRERADEQDAARASSTS